MFNTLINLDGCNPRASKLVLYFKNILNFKSAYFLLMSKPSNTKANFINSQIDKNQIVLTIPVQKFQKDIKTYIQKIVFRITTLLFFRHIRLSHFIYLKINGQGTIVTDLYV